MENSFYEVLGHVDAVLKGQQLDSRRLDEILPFMSEPAVRNYAFGIIEDPGWLKPLLDQKLAHIRHCQNLLNFSVQFGNNLLWSSSGSE